MPRTAREVPPPLELLCLRALWTLGEGNVKAVRQIVAESRPLAYTTIMTVLDRLVRKGMLTRRKLGRSFAYFPQSTRDAARRAALRELLDGYFDGSEEELLQFLRRRAEEQPPVRVRVEERIDTVLL
jgi:predicted transcriptional regulator